MKEPRADGSEVRKSGAEGNLALGKILVVHHFYSSPAAPCRGCLFCREGSVPLFPSSELKKKTNPQNDVASRIVFSFKMRMVVRVASSQPGHAEPRKG